MKKLKLIAVISGIIFFFIYFFEPPIFLYCINNYKINVQVFDYFYVFIFSWVGMPALAVSLFSWSIFLNLYFFKKRKQQEVNNNAKQD